MGAREDEWEALHGPIPGGYSVLGPGFGPWMTQPPPPPGTLGVILTKHREEKRLRDLAVTENEAPEADDFCHECMRRPPCASWCADNVEFPEMERAAAEVAVVVPPLEHDEDE